MKTLKILLVAVVLSISMATAQTPTIGDLSLYQTLSRSNIISYFGVPSTETSAGKGEEDGQEVSESRYWYLENGNSYFNLSYINYSGRISRVAINKRDANYAINGILMVGDPISKVAELGYGNYQNYNLYNYLTLPLPQFSIGVNNFYYYLRINYNDQNIIQSIFIEEDTGI